jgi:hypothetical protein
MTRGENSGQSKKKSEDSRPYNRVLERGIGVQAFFNKDVKMKNIRERSKGWTS